LHKTSNDLANANGLLQHAIKDLNNKNTQLNEANGSLQSETRLALSRELAADSLNTFDDHPDLALLEAAAAESIRPSRESKDALMRDLIGHGELRRTFHPTHGASSVAVSPDGSLVAIIGQDGSISMWNRMTGRPLPALAESGSIDQAWFGPGDLLALSTTDDPRIDLFDTRTGASRGTITYPNGASVRAFAFAPDGGALAVGVLYPTVAPHIDEWDIRSAPRRTHSQPTGTDCGCFPTAIQYSPDGRTLAWAESDPGHGFDSAIVVRDLPGGVAHVQVDVRSDGAPLTAIVFAPDNRTVASAISNAQVWNLSTRTAVPGQYLAVSADGHEVVDLVAVSPQQQLEVRDVQTGLLIGTPLTLAGDYPLFNGVALDDDRSTLVIIDPSQQVRDVRYVPLAAPYARRQRFPGERSVSDLSHDGTHVAFSDGSLVRVVDLATGQSRVFDAGGLSIDAGPVFSTDDRSIAFIGGTDAAGGSEAFVGDFATGRVIQWPIPIDPMQQGTVALSADDSSTPAAGARLAISGFDESLHPRLEVWDVAGRALVEPQPSPPPSLHPPQAQFARNGILVIESLEESNTDFTFWDGLHARTISTLGVPSAFAINSNATTLAVGLDQALQLIRTGDGRLLGTLAFPSPYALAFSADGSLLASGDASGNIALWDVASAQPVGPYLHEPDLVPALAFTASGDLVSSSSGGFCTALCLAPDVTDWNIRNDALVADACAIANRALTQAEWDLLVGDAVPFADNIPCAEPKQQPFQ
jgi:WD40 repeat protein